MARVAECILRVRRGRPNRGNGYPAERRLRPYKRPLAKCTRINLGQGTGVAVPTAPSGSHALKIYRPLQEQTHG